MAVMISLNGGARARDTDAGPRFTERDTETVTCCVCHVPGRVRFRLEPFAVVQCPVCALVYVSPRLGPEALQRLYDEPEYFEEGGVYGAQQRLSPAMVLQRLWTAGRLKALRGVIPAPAGLLEIGSAYGLFLAAAKKAGYEVRGVELSATGAEHSRSAYGLDVFCGQLADSPADRASVICAFDTIEHVPDPLLFLRQVRERLTGDGVVLLSLPYISSLPARLLGRRWWTLKPEQHITHFTPATLRLVAARAGLVVTDVIRSPLARSNFGRLDSMVAVLRALPEEAPTA